MIDLLELHVYQLCSIGVVVGTCRSNKIPIIVAASSTSGCLLELEYREASRRYDVVYSNSVTHTIKPLSEEKAFNLVRQLHPSEDDEMHSYIVNNSGCIPGLIALSGSNKFDFSSRLINTVDRHWSILAMAIKNTGNPRSSLYLLVAFKNQIPFNVFELSRITIGSEILIKCNVLYIQGDRLGSYYDTDLLNRLQLKIEYPSKESTSVRGGFIDEPSCISFCYECEIVHALCKLNMMVQGFHPCEDDNRSIQLSLLFTTYNRYDYAERGSVVKPGVLFMLKRGANAIDYFAITTFQGASYLLVIKLSIQQKSNLNKMSSSVVRIPSYMFSIHEEHKDAPDRVIYAYINPNVDFTFSEGVQCCTNLVSKSMRSYGRNFFFAMPSAESEVILKTHLDELKKYMHPSIMYL